MDIDNVYDKLPYIFIIDLDGTIIGDCTYQCDIYNIYDVLKKNSVKTKNKNILVKCYKRKSKLIRPFFLYFYKKMKKTFNNCLFYIYTSSDKEWANKEIQLIEKTHNIKFNRPLFTREDCIIGSNNECKKSIKKILPKILRRIKVKDNDNNIKEKILVIDNKKVYIDYIDNLLICPTYNFKLFNNLWEVIPKESLKIKELQNIINFLINSKRLCSICNHSDNMNKLELIHNWLYNKYKNINNNNKKYKNDNFWKKITNMIIKKNINYFDKKIINYLHNNI